MPSIRVHHAVPDADPLRQGDVLRADKADGSSSPSWFVVVTADCDIAQRKMGSFLTCLEIVTATDYLTHFWAADELEKLHRKYVDLAADLILAADQARDSKVMRLSSSEIDEWLQADEPERITALLKMEGRAAAECVRALQVARTKTQAHLTALERLKAVWAILRRNDKDQQGAIRNALKPPQMRADYMLLPSLPCEREVGFVVLLRAVSSVSPGEVYGSGLAHRIAGASGGYVRLGRFEDFVRYAIAQRWAVLYSRIGMTSHFESECEAAADMAVSQLQDD